MPRRYLIGAVTNPPFYIHPRTPAPSTRTASCQLSATGPLYPAALKFPRFPSLSLIAACFDFAQSILDSRSDMLPHSLYNRERKLLTRNMIFYYITFIIIHCRFNCANK